MSVLRHRLAGMGWNAFRFSYPTVGAKPSDNAGRLVEFIDRIDAPVLHLVGHSLGGLVIRHLFHLYPDQRPGRVVTLGTPHRGSRAAAALAKTSPGRFALGESLEHGLCGGVPEWTGRRELGTVAGSRSVGLGRMFVHLQGPNDGTVAAAEATLPHAKDHIILPITHFGMLFSGEVALHIQHFLRRGRFDHARSP